jgi:redox-sensitive bicupin YhaK (pirin superfamily)
MSSSSTVQRTLDRTVTLPPPARGFAGEGHTAIHVLDPDDFARQDPFIMLADDRLELPEGAPVGGEHPHAGFEIATFVLEGSLHDRDEGVLHAGDVQWTTAGRGIIHNEHVTTRGRTRILQLWLVLPEAERWTEPDLETIPRDAAPLRREPGVEVHVYSGASGDVRVQRRSHVPVTLLDIVLDAGATLEQDLPASYNGFLYVLEGTLRAGEREGAPLGAGQVGWLDRPDREGPSTLRLTGAGPGRTRAVLYAGEPQHTPMVSHGPFVGGSREDLMRMSREYLAGRFQRVSDLVRSGARG